MKIFLLLLLAHYILFYYNKKKGLINNTLNCGLFGWVGDDPSKFNKDKFDKLGIYNIIRGKHSCGIRIDDKIHKGIGVESEYDDFIAKNIIERPEKSSVVIGHTRHATVGKHTMTNAHPFKFDFPKEKAYFVGAHNGTLVNHKYLAKKYGIDDSNKIDSQILLEILSKDDENINVLSEYYGAAALLMHTSKEPNTLFLFRGKSKHPSSYNVEDEERPLFYWQESDTSMYVSSLKESLYAIMNTEKDRDNIFEVKPNTIYKIKNGKIVVKVTIDRSKAKDLHFKQIANDRKNTYLNPTNNNTNSRVGTQSVNNTSSDVNSYKTDNIFYEKPLIKNNMNDITFSNLRFRRENKLLSGIFVFIEEVGYVKICDRFEDVSKELKNFKFLDKSITPKPETIVLGDITNEVTLFYMFEGVLLDTPEDYGACLDPSKTRKKEITYEDLSDMASHPIIDLKRLPSLNTVIPKDRQNIKIGNRNYTGTLRVPGTNISYIISNGNLFSTRVSDSMIEHSDTSIKTLDLYKYIGDSNFEDEDDDSSSFEEGVEESLNYDSIDELDTMIEIMNNYTTAIKDSEMLGDSNSNVAKLLFEASETVEKTLEPIINILAKVHNA